MSTQPASLKLTRDTSSAGLAGQKLDQALARLHELLKQLAEVAGDKLDAIRRADAAALHVATAREAALLETLPAVAQERAAALAQLAQALQWPRIQSARVPEIADRLPEPSASALRSRGLALRQIAEDLRKKNRIAAEVAQRLQQHMRSIFADIAKANQESVVYGPRGNHEQITRRFWLDAVG